MLEKNISRRTLLKFGAATAAAMTIPTVPLFDQIIPTYGQEIKTAMAYIRPEFADEFVEIGPYTEAAIHLHDLAWFALPLQADGTIGLGRVWNSLTTDPKIKNLIKIARDSDTKNLLVINQFSPKAIDNFLSGNNIRSREQSVDNILKTVNALEFDGVSIDLESLDDIGPLNRARFTSMVENLNQRLKEQNPKAKLDVAVSISSADSSQIWDVDQFAKFADKVVLMGYDYYNPFGGRINPNAPLYGGGRQYWSDINQHVSSNKELLSLRGIPASKLVLAMPLYGNGGTVRSSNPTDSPSFGDLIVEGAGYRTVSNDLQFRLENKSNPRFIEEWASIAQADYCALDLGNGLWKMSVVDQARARNAKYDLVAEKGLGGVGFWVLDHMTYGPQDQNFWKDLHNHLNP
jgi:GH18 family chitinase